MIQNFNPKNGVIESFLVPYFCPGCDFVTLQEYKNADVKNISEDIDLMTSCQKCGDPTAEIDVIVPTFFKFLKS